MRLAVALLLLSASTALAQGPTQVSLGSGFGCGLDGDGTVRCWGNCGDGQCGSEGGDALTPRPVTGLDEVTDMQVGYSFACALRADHTMWCWGNNDYYQLGIEGIDQRTSAGPVPGLTDVAQIAVGAFHACARLEDGQVRCWGSNSQGVLVAPESVEKRARPTAIPRVGRVTELWSGQYNACARDRRGRVKCWGASVYGQSGTRRRVRRAPATRLRGDTAASAVSMGSGQACLLDDGALRCWGQNLYGAGDGAQEFFSTPQLITEISNVISISVRAENQCAVSEGRVYCWGVNRMHQLHVPTEEAGQVVVHPSAVPGLTDATQVALGWSAQCAQRQSGAWVCWGRNYHGAVGVGSRDTMISRPLPLPW